MRILARLGLVGAGIVAGLALLAALELLLRLTGVGAGAPAYDPMVGFSAAVPLFEQVARADGTPIFRVTPARLIGSSARESSPQREFLLKKPANGFRAFVVGESSAAGYPYPPAYAFGSWLERRLAASLPDLTVEVVNAAVAGYSSRRALVAMREIVLHEPDLVIVYSGHNEWAERRYYSRLIEMDPRLFRLRERLFGTRLFALASRLADRGREQPERALARYVEAQQEEFSEMFGVLSRRAEGEGYASPDQIEQRDTLYRLNLEEIARIVRGAGAALALVTLSQNFADWEPGASSHRPDLAAAERAQWQARFDAGERSAAEADCTAALAAWRAALAIDDEFALLHYRVAGCERRLGRFEAARAHYRRASDLDPVPHGAPTSFNDLIRGVARRSGALLVDAEAAFDAASEHGLVGGELFVDFLHPNLRGHHLIAKELARALREAGIPRPAGEWRELVWVEPAPEALTAAEPTLLAREHEALRFTCVVARRPACVQQQVEALERLAARGVRAFESAEEP